MRDGYGFKEGEMCFILALTQKKAGFPCSGLNAGSSFISQGEGMSESPVETLEKAIVLNLFWREGLTSI